MEYLLKKATSNKWSHPKREATWEAVSAKPRGQWHPSPIPPLPSLHYHIPWNQTWRHRKSNPFLLACHPSFPFGMEMLTLRHCTLGVDNWIFHFYGIDSSQLTCISGKTLNLGFWTVLEFLHLGVFVDELNPCFIMRWSWSFGGQGQTVFHYI